MALFLRDFPFDDIIVELKGKAAGKSSQTFNDWAASLTRQSEASPVRPQPAEVLADVQANGSGTLGGSQAAGLYRVTGYAEVTTADPVSSSLRVDLGWTHNGKAMTRLLFNFAGAPQTTTDSTGAVAPIAIDPGTSISYTITYASNTPGVARYDLILSAELIQTIA